MEPSLSSRFNSSSRTLVSKQSLISDLSSLPPYRKVLILSALCTAFFIDALNTSSLISAIPIIADQLHISANESPWIYAGYQLTFASFLLVAGRLTDLYNPRWLFLLGSTSMAAFSLAGGFMRSEIPLIIFRALMGISAALTVPSSQSLTIYLFVDPVTQAKALGTFGAMAGLGAVFGLLVGALFVEFVSWDWVFFFTAIVSGFVSISFLILVPRVQRNTIPETKTERILRFKRIDLFGVSMVTGAQILFILAMTSSSSTGWRSAQVIAPLILSVFLFIGFFVWETFVPEDRAAIPPSTWKYKNVTILLALSMVPYMFWGCIYPLFSWFWETVFHWSPVKVALHHLPVALGSIPAITIATLLVPKIGAKLVLITGFIFLIIGSVLLPFFNTEGRYWSFGFPGLLIGTFGGALIYITTNIALFANTPPTISGIISSLYLAAAQTGAAASLAVATSIQTSIQNRHGGPTSTSFDGTAAGLWFLLGIFVVFAILLVVFMKNTPPGNPSAVALGKEEVVPVMRESMSESAPQIGPLDHGHYAPVDAGVRAPAAVDEEGEV